MRTQTDRQLPALLIQLVEQQTLVPSLFRDHPQPMALYDLEGHIVVGNEAATRLLGHPSGALVGSHFSAHLAPDCLVEAQKARELAVAGSTSEFDAVFVHADGHPVNVTATVIPARLADEVVGVYGVVRDVRREREAAVLEHSERLRSLFLVGSASGRTAHERIADALALGNDVLGVESGVVLRPSDGAVRPTQSVGAFQLESMRELALETVDCTRMFATFDPVAVDDSERPPWNHDPARARLPWRSYIATTFEIEGTFAGIVLFGARHERGALFSTADREFVRLISAVVGASLERQIERERLDALTFSDTLTGLPNRALLGDRLQQLIADSRRNHEAFAVHLLDLDGFKHVNETAGRADGDAVLREAAQRLKDALRESDSVARLGGDEFIILQKHVRQPGEAVALARALLDLMRLPFLIDGKTFGLSASVGISIFPGDGDNTKILLRNADIALHRAKSAGRNRVSLYGHSVDTVSSRSRMAESVRE